MNTRDLISFCQIYEHRSINHAARDMFITAQGLSKVVQNLEIEFGVKLFIRTKNGVTPTEAGKLLYLKSHQLLDDLSNIQLEMAQIARKNVSLKVGLSCGATNIFPPGYLQDFKKHFNIGGYFIEDSLTSIVNEKFKNREIDIAISIGEFSDEQCIVIPVTKKRLGVIVYEGHRFYDRESVTIEELRDEPIVVLNEQFYCYKALVNNCHLHDFQPNIIAKTIENQIIIEYCRQKLAIGFNTEFSLNPFNITELRFIPMKENLLWPVILFYRKENSDSPLTNAFVDYVKDCFKF